MRCWLPLLLLVAACAPAGDPPPDEPSAAGVAPEPPAGPDTLRITTDDRTLAARPIAPVRVDGGCPFEGCIYGTWTTSGETTVYGTPGDSTSAAFTVPAETALDAASGFVLVTRVGEAVATRATELYLAGGATRPLAEGDTLRLLDYEGEGSHRAWFDGALGFSGAGADLAPPGEPGPPLRQVVAPEQPWWVRVTTPDGQAGWLWMDQTPPVRDADALGV